jgi:hypothetical protein
VGSRPGPGRHRDRAGVVPHVQALGAYGALDSLGDAGDLVDQSDFDDEGVGPSL